MAAPRVLVVIPGFGNPHSIEKLDILRRNISALSCLKPDYRIFAYESVEVPEDIADKTTWIFERGIIGEFIKKYITPEFVRGANGGAYDYIIVLLDDIELQAGINYAKVLEFLDKMDLDMVSPCLETREMSYWGEIMCQRKWRPDLVARIMNFVELFCYIFRADAYCDKYWPFVDAENPWMWGMDFILKTHIDLKAAILNHVTMKHYYANSAYSKELNDPRRDSEKYLERHGTSWEQIHANPKIKIHICELIASIIKI